MERVYHIGDRVKTYEGTPANPEYVYATITATTIDADGYIMYCLSYDGGGYDYMYDFEIEPA